MFESKATPRRYNPHSFKIRKREGTPLAFAALTEQRTRDIMSGGRRICVISGHGTGLLLSRLGS